MALKALNSGTAQRASHPVRILQFGEGNFLRAFADWMIDIANEKGVADASVAVVAPRFGDKPSIRALRRQDGLYHVVLEGVERGEPKRQARLVTCVAKALSPSVDYDEYAQAILSPELQLVISNTTEAGIRYEKDDVLADIPATFPGKVANLLWRRYMAGLGGLVFICCELIEDNGSRLRQCVERQARENSLPGEFIDWIGRECAFCDSLVDRIVPGFPADSIAQIQDELGYEDELVVKGELYHLWVIGGQGWEAARRLLPLDKAGLHVVFTPDVAAYRDKKVRILNGSHTGMTPVALQMGCETVRQAFDNPLVNQFVNSMVQQEVLPMIDGDPAELRAFADGILERFYNPYVRHMLKSIALNSLSKWEARNFPTAKDYRSKTGRTAEREAFSLAALLALYRPGSGFEPDDNPAHVAAIQQAWQQGDCQRVVDQALGSGIFLENLEHAAPGLSAATARHLQSIIDLGMPKALENLLAQLNQ